MDLEEAVAVIEKDREDRIERCRRRIDQALKEERCLLNISVLVTNKGNIPKVDIVSKD